MFDLERSACNTRCDRSGTRRIPRIGPDSLLVSRGFSVQGGDVTTTDAPIDIVDRARVVIRDVTDCCHTPEIRNRFERDGHTLLMCGHHSAQHWLRLTADGWVAYRKPTLGGQ
jgi:hypothetical protein